MDFETRAASSSVAERDPATRVAELEDRVRVCEDAVGVLRRAGLHLDRVAIAEDSRYSLSRELARAKQRDGAGGVARATLDRFEAEIESAEKTLVAVDGLVSMDLFRRVFAPPRDGSGAAPQVDPQVVLHYARLLARHFDGVPKRTQRIDFLVQRLLAGEHAGGGVAVRPRKEVESKLWYLVHHSHADSTVRAAAVAFFRGAIERLGEIELLDELFESGFSLDVAGYKVALRESLLDPDILYVCAELNAAMQNRISALMELEGAAESTVRPRFEAVRASINEIFSGEGEAQEKPAEISRRFERKREAAKSAAEEYRSNTKLGLGVRIAMAIAAVFVVAIVLGVGRRSVRNENELVPAGNEAIAKVSRYLESGSFSRGSSETVFVGKLSTGAWQSMDHGQREGVAKSIAFALSAENVLSALVYCDKTVAVHVMEGHVLYVE